MTRYTAGDTLRALSREFGISRSGLRQLLQSEGAVLRVHGISSDDADEAERLYSSGLTISQVVKKLDPSYGTVRKVLHERGVTLRAGGRVKRVASDG